MITRTEKGFSVEVKTGGHPAEDYVETMNDIIDCLQCNDRELNTSDNYHALFNLLKEMLPDHKQARAMFDEIKDL
jgi:hypothetical protein